MTRLNESSGTLLHLATARASNALPAASHTVPQRLRRSCWALLGPSVLCALRCQTVTAFRTNSSNADSITEGKRASPPCRCKGVLCRFVNPHRPYLSGPANVRTNRTALLPNLGPPDAGVFPARSGRRAGCVAGIMQSARDVISDRAVGSVLIVVSTPSLQLFLGICKAHEPMRVQAFQPELAVEREEGSKNSPGDCFSRRKRKPLSVGLPRREKSRVTSLA